MGNLIALAEWLGKRGELLKPEELQFEAKQQKGCSGCLFDNQRSEVCRKANAVAHLAGIVDCDMGFIYVLRETDPRQITIEV